MMRNAGHSPHGREPSASFTGLRVEAPDSGCAACQREANHFLRMPNGLGARGAGVDEGIIRLGIDAAPEGERGRQGEGELAR